MEYGGFQTKAEGRLDEQAEDVNIDDSRFVHTARAIGGEIALVAALPLRFAARRGFSNDDSDSFCVETAAMKRAREAEVTFESALVGSCRVDHA